MDELAKKVAELFGKPEEVTETEKGKPAPAAPIPSRPLYLETAEAVEDACWEIDANWLADTHPDLWLRLVSLDEQASRLERQGETGQPEYQTILNALAATVRKARTLYKQAMNREVSGGN